MEDAIDAAFSDEEFAEVAKTKSQKTRKMHRANIQRNRLRLDSTAMNLDRRFFADLAANRKDDVISMHLFTDGSPVTGHEFQGMILQIYLRVLPFLITLVMPGVMLHYSGTGLSSKLFAFMWSLYLTAGTDMDVLKWILDTISSITTDMGTELGMTDTACILAAFMLWLAGAPAHSLTLAIDPSTRMFPRALKIAG